MRDSLWDIAYWWTETLRRKFHNFYPARISNSSEPVCLIVKDGFILSCDGGTEVDTVPISHLNKKLDELSSPVGGPTGAISVVLGRDRYVVRKLSPLILPLSKQMAMAELDLAVSTPFQPSDVYLWPLVAEKNKSGTAYAIVKKSVIDPLLRELRLSGRRIGALGLLDPANGKHSVRQSAVDTLQANGVKKINRLALGSFTISLFVLATFAHAYFRSENAIAQLDERNRALTQDAKEVRTIIDQRTARIAELNGLRNQIASSTPVTVVWEELARALPDSSYLTDMSVKDKAVSISGYSVAASSLIGVLEGSSLFEKAEFAGAVVKVPGFDGDRFSINLQLGGKP